MRLAAMAATVGALALAPQASAASGGLDPAFAGGGMATFAPNGAETVLTDAAAQPDGKIVVSGLTRTPDPNGGEQTVGVVARYDVDGALDGSFGTGGVRTIDLGGTHVCLPVSDWSCPAYVTLQSHGKIVVAVNGVHGGGHGASSAMLARFNPDGTTDTSFGDGGETLVPRFAVRGLAIASSGRLVIAGFHDGRNVVARYGIDGLPDSSFGNGGIARTGNRRYLVRNVAVQDDGRIVTAGEECGQAHRCSGDEIAATRLRAGGGRDRSFSGNGMTTIKLWGHVREAGANALTVDKGGRVAVAGFARTPAQVKFAIARLRRDGRLDPSFGSSGRVAVGFGEPDAGGVDGVYGARSIVAAGNRLYAAGAVGRDFVDGAFAVVAFTSHHGIARGFGSDGKVRTAPPAGSPRGCAAANAATVVPGHRLAVAGYAYGCDEQEEGYEGPPDAGAIAVYVR